MRPYILCSVKIQSPRLLLASVASNSLLSELWHAKAELAQGVFETRSEFILHPFPKRTLMAFTNRCLSFAQYFLSSIYYFQFLFQYSIIVVRPHYVPWPYRTSTIIKPYIRTPTTLSNFPNQRRKPFIVPLVNVLKSRFNLLCNTDFQKTLY